MNRHRPIRSGALFHGMAKGGLVGFETVDWFNGGLFDDATALPLEKPDIDTVLAASKLDWSEIDPSILGTLLERGLDRGKRAQFGAHYTDRNKIMLNVGSPLALAQPAEVDLPRFRGRVRTWVSSTLRQLSPLVVDG